MSILPLQSPDIGFVILSHANPDQLLRLVRTLNRVYGFPPIAVHHDSHQSKLDGLRFGTNVHFVSPSLKTGWAKFSVVRAGIKAIRLLYKVADPDWFFLLSAADYPIKRASEVRHELSTSTCDAYMDSWNFNELQGGFATYVGERNPKLSHFGALENRIIKQKFFFGVQIWFPVIRREPHWRVGRYTFRFLLKGTNPFTKDFHPLYGDHWFCANRRAARVLVSQTVEAVRLQRHLSNRPQGDEGYYQMILGNTPGLKICRDNKRFAEWNGGGAHPINLSETQMQEVFSSGAFFARKFVQGSEVLDIIDRKLE